MAAAAWAAWTTKSNRSFEKLEIISEVGFGQPRFLLYAGHQFSKPLILLAIVKAGGVLTGTLRPIAFKVRKKPRFPMVFMRFLWDDCVSKKRFGTSLM